MAARRLIIVMVVLLGISTIAAAFAPVRDEEDPAPPPRTERDQPESEPAASGVPDVKRVKVRVNNRPSPTIRVRPGQELVLSVSSRFGDDVEIPALGLVETMSEYAPAVFEIYLEEPTVFGVSTVGSERLVAKVVVSDAPAGGGAQRVERGVPAGPDPQRGGTLAD